MAIQPFTAAQPQGPAPESITTHRAWRHTIGRLSCLPRAFIYTSFFLAQIAKIAVKTVIATVTLGQLYRVGPVGHRFTFKAIVRDGIAALAFLDRIVNSAFCVVFAPPKQYRSLADAFAKSAEIVFFDKYHFDKKEGKETTLFQILGMITVKRPQLHKQIIQRDYIGSDKLLSEKVRKAVQAG